MLRSMTGFGRATAVIEGRQLSLEIRSVNGKGLDVKLRGRELDAEAELALGRLVRESVNRGSLIITIDEESPPGALDAERVRTLHDELEALRLALGMGNAVSLDTVAAFLIATERGAGGHTRRTGLGWAVIGPLARDALAALLDLRASEGLALGRDLEARVTRLKALAAEVATLSAPLAARAAAKLRERIVGLAAEAPLDHARLATEVALLADKLDVTEEKVRLDAHLAQLAAWLTTPAPDPAGVGRRIEFLLQEIGREINTIGSKTQDAGIASRVVEAKAELEKIREQSQNIE